MRDARLLLADIRISCEKVLRFAGDLSQEAFVADERSYDATLRNLEVIGEAVKGLPADLRAAHPEVPWQRIAGLRDILIHVYFGVDEDVVWDIVKNHVPDLLKVVEALLVDQG